jgi:hypothetical protein
LSESGTVDGEEGDLQSLQERVSFNIDVLSNLGITQVRQSQIESAIYSADVKNQISQLYRYKKIIHEI